MLETGWLTRDQWFGSGLNPSIRNQVPMYVHSFQRMLNLIEIQYIKQMFVCTYVHTHAVFIHIGSYISCRCDTYSKYVIVLPAELT